MTSPAFSDANQETLTSAQFAAIAREAEERLGTSRYRAIRDVSCIASEGVLYLHGDLPSHYLKQIAQELALGARGVRHVVNRIIVSRPSRSGLDRESCASPSI